MLPGLIPVFAGRGAGVSVNYLVVAGGGGGGAQSGGGGAGAGGMLTGSQVFLPGIYTITVGAGGAGGGTAGSGTNGGNSSVGALVAATGGGFGAGGASGVAGGNGGSGGAGAGTGSGPNGTGIPGQGNNATVSGGSGGGAGAVGAANGGAGLASSISGASVTYAGGGAGVGASPGVGGGGAPSTPGAANTGGGGGAWSGSGAAGAGGAGVVILSYPTGSMVAAGGTITTAGGNTIHTFTASGEWSVTGPSVGGNDSFTKLLLHADGVAGSNVVTDSSASNHVMTAGGSGTLATDFVKFGTASLGFNGVANCYYGASAISADYAFGTADFTVELWFRVQGWQGSNYQILIDLGGAPNIIVYVDPAGTISLWNAGGGKLIQGTTVLTLGKWFHMAVARAAAVTRLFLNGMQEGPSYADTNNYTALAFAPVMGISSVNYSSYPLFGRMDEVRISKGIARYTANFTPPTGPFG